MILFNSIFRLYVGIMLTDVPRSITLSVGLMEIHILMNASCAWKMSEYKLKFILKSILS